MTRLLQLFLITLASFVGYAAETVSNGVVRTTHFGKTPMGNWKCATGSEHKVSDFTHCLALLNCKVVSCFVIVVDHAKKSCCAVAAPYDWVIQRVGEALLKEQPDVDAVIVWMHESSRAERQKFANVWPPASAMFLDRTNQLANFGYRSGELSASANKIYWTNTGSMIPSKTVRPLYANFNRRKRSYIKLWPAERFNFNSGVTIAMWVRISVPKYVRSALFDFRTDGGRPNYVWLYQGYYSSGIYTRVASRGLRTIRNVVRNKGPWTHVAFTWSPSQRQSIFVNGVSQALTVYLSGTDNVFGTGRYVYLGRGHPYEYDGFSGGFACVFIYEKALTSNDLKNVMQLC